jgi:hypothetical protein
MDHLLITCSNGERLVHTIGETDSAWPAPGAEVPPPPEED